MIFGKKGSGISIHPPLAGRDPHKPCHSPNLDISIHPPLAGRDRGRLRSCAHGTIFQSTRPLRGGTARDFVLMQTDAFQSTRPLRGGTRSAKDWRDYTRFQSTRPLRGGTWATSRRTPSSSHFNPPAPCGAGRQILRGRGHGLYFNPPAPCGAGPGTMSRITIFRQFQSTRPLRGGTATKR